jgi:hypothetical protein
MRGERRVRFGGEPGLEEPAVFVSHYCRAE